MTLVIVYQRERDTKNPLEPLLLKFAKEFSDDQDLSERLADMYKVLLQLSRKRGAQCATSNACICLCVFLGGLA